MGLSWQEGPLSTAPVGRFLTAEPIPEHLLFAEPLRRRMRVKFGDEWIADSEDVVLLHEPGHYPVAFFPIADVRSDALTAETRVTQHRELGDTSWFTVAAGGRTVPRAAWRYTALPSYEQDLGDRVAFAWRAMDAFFEEDERIVGHAADPYHRIDIRQTSRHLVVTDGDRVVADTTRPVVLYESGFAPRWYVPRADVDPTALLPADGQTFCPYKLLRHRRTWRCRVVLSGSVAGGGAHLGLHLVRAGSHRRIHRRQETRARGRPDGDRARHRPRPRPGRDRQPQPAGGTGMTANPTVGFGPVPATLVRQPAHSRGSAGSAGGGSISRRWYQRTSRHWPSLKPTSR